MNEEATCDLPLVSFVTSHHDGAETEQIDTLLLCAAACIKLKCCLPLVLLPTIRDDVTPNVRLASYVSVFEQE